MNPTYKVIVFNESNIRKIPYFTDERIKALTSRNGYAMLSDFLRAYMLSNYGGIWTDATILCLRPLSDTMLNSVEAKVDLVAYHNPGHCTLPQYPVIENWFLAAPVNSQFMKDWFTEMTRVLAFPSNDAYIQYVTNVEKFSKQKMQPLPYLVVYLCANVVQQRNYHKYVLKLTSIDAPYSPVKAMLRKWWQYALKRTKPELLKFSRDDMYFRNSAMVKFISIQHKLLRADSRLWHQIYSATRSEISGSLPVSVCMNDAPIWNKSIKQFNAMPRKISVRGGAKTRASKPTRQKSSLRRLGKSKKRSRVGRGS